MLLSISSTVGIALDVIIVAMLVIFGFVGFKKGFFKSILSIFSTIVVLIISFFGAGPLARLINKIYDFTGLMAGKICAGMADMGTFYTQTIPDGMTGKEVADSIPASTNGFLKKLMSYVLDPLSASDIEGATVAEIVSGAFASIIMLIISAILLFVLIKVVIAIVSRLFENITRNRVFGATNKILGLVFGALKGLLIVVVFTIMLTLLTVIPTVNNKMTPIIQDNTKIARPLYNYTDEMVEKLVIDGKIVQKWIDNLWENKYKDRGDDTIVPPTSGNGSIEHPYEITFTESEGVYTATITLDFTNLTESYYKLDPSLIETAGFSLGITASVDYSVMDSANLDTAIEDLTVMDKAKTYLIKFTKGAENQVQATVTLTPII